MNLQSFTALLCLLILTGCSGAIPKLGAQNSLLEACPSSPKCVSSQADDKTHFIEPIKATGSVSAVKKDLLTILEGIERTVITSAEGNYIRAECASKVFGFVDDIEFLIINVDNSDDVLIHVRSSAREGYFDFGVNRKRIESIRQQMASMIEAN